MVRGQRLAPRPRSAPYSRARPVVGQHHVVGVRLKLSAAREQGRGFAEAWATAVTKDGLPADWLEAIEGCRDAWQRAYDLEPPTAKEAAAGRLDGLDADTDVARDLGFVLIA